MTMEIHSDGAKMYEIFNAAGVIMRVACAVHVRRPLWKLKETSDDAARVVYLLENVFRKERTWNDEEGMTSILPHRWVEPVTIPLVY